MVLAPQYSPVREMRPSEHIARLPCHLVPRGALGRGCEYRWGHLIVSWPVNISHLQRTWPAFFIVTIISHHASSLYVSLEEVSRRNLDIIKAMVSSPASIRHRLSLYAGNTAAAGGSTEGIASVKSSRFPVCRRAWLNAVRRWP